MTSDLTRRQLLLGEARNEKRRTGARRERRRKHTRDVRASQTLVIRPKDVKGHADLSSNSPLPWPLAHATGQTPFRRAGVATPARPPEGTA